jgi:two-component system sensor kinase FixL
VKTQESPWFPIPVPIIGFIWVLGSGFVDWWTGPELATSAFYLPGIILVGWFAGRLPSLCIAAFAGIMWLLAELLMETHYVHPLIPYWNGLTRLTVFIVTALLISEVRIRKRAESALHDQKEILSSVLDSMDDGVVVVSREGRIITLNPAARRLLGEAEENSAAAEWVDQVEKSQRGHSSNIQPLRLAVEGQIMDYEEIFIQRSKETDPTPLGLSVLPMLGGGVRQGGVVLVFHDLTVYRKLENQISQASEREQRRIGQDLHDGICQHLAGVTFAVGALRTELERMELPKQAEMTSEIGRLIRQGIQQTKDLARGLYPMGIEEGLDVALGALASTTSERLDIPCRYQQTGGGFRLGATTAGHLYRIAQEAVSNAVRHARPANINISLSHQADHLTLEISDDGVGLDTSRNTERGIGLQIMRYRANLVGAKLKITSQEGGGTRICCQTSLVS